MPCDAPPWDIAAPRPRGAWLRRRPLLSSREFSGHRGPPRYSPEPLITALARAFHWQELIDGGKYGSITELADALGLDRSYVSRVMRSALIDPDIVEAIVDGREPSGLSLERLVKGVPVGWAEQREGLGFPVASKPD